MIHNYNFKAPQTMVKWISPNLILHSSEWQDLDFTDDFIGFTLFTNIFYGSLDTDLWYMLDKSYACHWWKFNIVSSNAWASEIDYIVLVKDLVRSDGLEITATGYSEVGKASTCLDLDHTWLHWINFTWSCNLRAWSVALEVVEVSGWRWAWIDSSSCWSIR